ncbi:MAG: GTP pyrophosphokinase family protein [Oscillospiraceae bacterium]|nr:GTP pyrophosphokinase family protein [Oscillospiraceae bacterium]
MRFAEELGQLLGISLTGREATEWLKENAGPYRELMTRYRCAMMEVETKFRVLSEELSLGDDRNPIETVKVRLKKPESILNKLSRNGYPMTVESIEQNINDIAGVRVICSFSSDIYMLADSLLKQDDVLLLQKKDYIAEPKPNGYRSLHLIIATPIFLHNSKRLMKVEVQLRTLAMDMWASLEHKLRYKKNAASAEMAAELLACAEKSAEIDRRMEKIYSGIYRTE